MNEKQESLVKISGSLYNLLEKESTEITIVKGFSEDENLGDVPSSDCNGFREFYSTGSEVELTIQVIGNVEHWREIDTNLITVINLLELRKKLSKHFSDHAINRILNGKNVVEILLNAYDEGAKDIKENIRNMIK